MRVLIVLGLLAASLTAAAKDRLWKDAIFLGTQPYSSGTVAVVPVGNMVIAGNVGGGRWYLVKCDGITYWLRANYTGHWPNLTVNGHTKLAIEGRHAHILDEDNKDRKFDIVQKVADQPTSVAPESH